MDSVHIHLILNHVPILLTIISIPIVLWGYYGSNRSILRLGLLGFLIAGLTVIPVFLTGETAHERVEDIQTISERYMEEHEEAAEVSLWLTVLLGVIGLGGLIIERFRPKFFYIYIVALFTVSVVTAGLLTYTGYLGGNIRHTELHSTTGLQKADAIHFNADSDNN